MVCLFIFFFSQSFFSMLTELDNSYQSIFNFTLQFLLSSPFWYLAHQESFNLVISCFSSKISRLVLFRHPLFSFLRLSTFPFISIRFTLTHQSIFITAASLSLRREPLPHSSVLTRWFFLALSICADADTQVSEGRGCSLVDPREKKILVLPQSVHY